MMESVEIDNSLQITTPRWGVHVTSFYNYLYMITHSWKRLKQKFYKKEEGALVEYMKNL